MRTPGGGRTWERYKLPIWRALAAVALLAWPGVAHTHDTVLQEILLAHLEGRDGA